MITYAILCMLYDVHTFAVCTYFSICIWAWLAALARSPSGEAVRQATQSWDGVTGVQSQLPVVPVPSRKPVCMPANGETLSFWGDPPHAPQHCVAAAWRLPSTTVRSLRPLSVGVRSLSVHSLSVSALLSGLSVRPLSQSLCGRSLSRNGEDCRRSSVRAGSAHSSSSILKLTSSGRLENCALAYFGLH